MDKQTQSVVKRTLGSWVFDGNTLLQVLLVVIIFVTVVARVIPLEMQKRIVNEAIYLKQLKLLAIYCTLYFVSVMTASLLKFFINVIQALISERATAAMRSALFDHILTMPLGFFRGTQPGTVVNSLVNELTLPGNFIGMAVAIPLTNILTLVAFAIYLFRLNPLLAGISFVIYPLMVVVIPLLQGRVNRENRRRINLSRQVSSTIVEAISGLHEVQANGGFALANRNFTRLVNTLKTIRVRWNLLKSGVKVVNNFGTSLGPVIIFVLGGYLTIRGELELGALVAFLSAQEKLYDPWKELVEFYQVYQDGSVTYYKTMGFYDVPIEHLMLPSGREPLKLLPAIETENLTLETGEGIKLIEDVTLSLKPGEHLALVGFSGSGKSTLAMCLAQLLNYTSGRAIIGGEEIRDLTRADMVCTLGLVSQSPFIFNGTIRENLEYAHAAIHGQEGFLAEKIDPTLDDLIYVLQQSGLFVDVLKFGLTTVIDRKDKALASTIIQVRKNFQADFGQEMEKWVEFYNEEQYLNHSSVGDNIIFGTARTSAFNADNLVENTFFMTFLDDADLLRPLLSLAVNLAEQTVDILKNIPDEALFFAQSPIQPDEFDPLQHLFAARKLVWTVKAWRSFRGNPSEPLRNLRGFSGLWGKRDRKLVHSRLDRVAVPFEELTQAGDNLGMLVGKVVRLGRILVQIVEQRLGQLVSFAVVDRIADLYVQLPRPLAHGVQLRTRPIEHFAARTGAGAHQGGGQIETIEHAVGRQCGARQSGKGG